MTVERDGLSITLTGTGIPVPSPGRAGAGTLVRVGATALQFDAGRSTTLRLAEAGVGCDGLSALFLTHHHSDHCVDVADLVMSRWVLRAPKLPVVAPAGALDRFGERLLDVWQDDLDIRMRVTGRAPVEMDWRSFEAEPKLKEVWRDDRATVSAVLVHHSPVEPAVGYRVDSEAGSVVISGDTRVCDAVESMSQGVDVLVHEVVLPQRVAHGHTSVIDYHADACELGAMAKRAGVRTLILTHLLPAPDTPELVAEYESEVRRGGYTGELLVGHDLLTFDVRAGRAS